jgi:hypothetical protein
VLLKQRILTILEGFAIEIFLQLTAFSHFAGVSLYLLLDEDEMRKAVFLCLGTPNGGRLKSGLLVSGKILQFSGKREAPFVFNR